MKTTVSGVNVTAPAPGMVGGSRSEGEPARSSGHGAGPFASPGSPAPETIPLSAVCAVCCLQARRGRLAWAA